MIWKPWPAAGHLDTSNFKAYQYLCIYKNYQTESNAPGAFLFDWSDLYWQLRFKCTTSGISFVEEVSAKLRKLNRWNLPVFST